MRLEVARRNTPSPRHSEASPPGDRNQRDAAAEAGPVAWAGAARPEGSHAPPVSADAATGDASILLTLLLLKLLVPNSLLLRLSRRRWLLASLLALRARERILWPAPPRHRKSCAALLSKLRTAFPRIALFARSPCHLETPYNVYLAYMFSTLLAPPAGGEQRRPNRPAEHAAPSATWTFAASPDELGPGLVG